MKSTRLAIAVSALLFVGACARTTQLPQLGDAPIAEVVAALTLEEKVALVTGQGMNFPGLQLSEEMQGPVVGQTANKVPGAAGTTAPIERLGIPSLVLADGPAGLRIQPVRDDAPDRTFHATAFPIATLLASSWDIDLVEQVGKAMGTEVKEYGADVLLAPAQNIHRYPLGGRNFEYYSEDPLVTGKMAAAAIRGIQSEGVGTSIKHYAVNNHEWNRNTIDVKVDERALREIYLRGFEIAVKESDPWTVMSSYNKVNGTYTSESGTLLTEILRDQWGYKGLVMTDWFGGSDAVAQMQAGNDLLMPGTQRQQEALLAAVRDGVLDEAVLDRNVTRVLELALRSPVHAAYAYSDKPDLQANARIARAAATEGMVLLKNEAETLPLASGANVALFGNGSYDMVTGGTGSGDVNEAYVISLPQGLEEAGLIVDKDLAQIYRDHIAAAEAARTPTPPFMPAPPLPELAAERAAIASAADNNAVALITISRNSGEFADRQERDDFLLTRVEQSLISEVSAAFRARGKPVVVVLNIGGVIETASWRDRADAILLAWQPGQEAGYAIADVLAGKANPSGKLATTFGLRLQDYPAHEGFPGVELEPRDPNDPNPLAGAKAAEITYRDGIWVGYRHFDTRGVDIAYPFGYGLSYTTFAYGGLTVDADGSRGRVKARVDIRNDGKAPGREVVQLYVSAPENGLEKPAHELRAFGKTRLLQPGESASLTFELEASDLASFDVAQGAWVAAPGRYALKVGASSRDIRQQAQFELAEAVVIEP